MGYREAVVFSFFSVKPSTNSSVEELCYAMVLDVFVVVCDSFGVGGVLELAVSYFALVLFLVLMLC